MANDPGSDSPKHESNFYRTDYVLLVASICGFALVLCSVVAILIGRRFRSQNTNNAADMERQSSGNTDRETTRLIVKPPKGRRVKIDQNSFTHKEKSHHKSCYGHSHSNTSKNKRVFVGDRPVNEDQLENLDEDVFRYMYPQLSLYNIFQSSKNSTDSTKPSLSITEITEDDEMYFSESLKITEDNLEKDVEVKEVKDDELPIPQREDLDKPGDAYDESVDKSLESSRHSINPRTYSSDHSPSSTTYTEDRGTTGGFYKVSSVRSTSKSQDDRERTNEGRDKWFSKADVETANSNHTAVTTNSLHSDLPTFAEKNAFIDGHLFCNPFEGGRELHSEEYDESELGVRLPQAAVRNNFQGHVVKSAGDNVHQDDVIVDNSDSSTATSWPGRLPNPLMGPLFPRLETDSHSNNIPLSSTLYTSTEERPFVNVNQSQSTLPGMPPKKHKNPDEPQNFVPSSSDASINSERS